MDVCNTLCCFCANAQCFMRLFPPAVSYCPKEGANEKKRAKKIFFFAPESLVQKGFIFSPSNREFHFK